MTEVINNDIVERSTTNYTQNLSTHHNMTRNLENINNEVYNNALRTTSNKGFYQNESQFESNMFHENEFVETKMEIAPELTDSFSQCEVNVQDSDDAQGIRQCNKDRLSSSIVKTRGKSLNGNTSFLGLSGYLWDTINKEGDKFIINDWDIFDHNNNRKTESMTTKHLHNASKMLNSKPQYAVTVSVFSLFIGNNFLKYLWIYFSFQNHEYLDFENKPQFLWFIRNYYPIICLVIWVPVDSSYFTEKAIIFMI